MVENENNKEKKYVMQYDYRKRTSGGIVDALFFGAIIIIIATFAFLYLMGGK